MKLTSNEIFVHKDQHTGDYDQMLEKRVIRVLVPYSDTFFFFDGPTPRGLIYEKLQTFEKMINQSIGSGHLKLHVLVIPTPRDILISSLINGKGDIAAGNLTITPDRSNLVDFSDPFLDDVNEILLTGPASPLVNALSDLSGNKVYVRPSSSYHESLVLLNQKFMALGKKKVIIIPISEYLEDEDIIEMLSAGLITMTIVDDHKANFWGQIFNNITLHPDIKVRENGRISWAFRKNSPKLQKIINTFVKENKQGTLMGNILFKRYLENTSYVKNNRSGKDRKRFEAAVDLFKKYGRTYQFDYLMLAALAYQESGIDQSKRSQQGAIGIMQVLPGTARDKNINISGIEKMEPNIHAGTKYLRFLMNRYLNDSNIDELNRMLLGFASYNAGPARISRLRKETMAMGLNPHEWFRNVEIAAAKKIGRETVQYVSNIFKYYIAYRLAYELADAKKGSNPIQKK